MIRYCVADLCFAITETSIWHVARIRTEVYDEQLDCF